MKFGQLFSGLLIGGLLGVGLTTYIENTKQQPQTTLAVEMDTSPKSGIWTWPDSMDAVKAAKENHKVVYEDDIVRVLAVLLDGKKSEPIHTHKWKSVMWIAKPITPCQIDTYKKDEKGNLVKSDSIIINEMPVNMGQLVDPEGPTSITNLGSDNGVAYRVEFKKEFK